MKDIKFNLCCIYKLDLFVEKHRDCCCCNMVVNSNKFALRAISSFEKSTASQGP